MNNLVELDLKLTNHDVAVILELLDKQVQGRRLAMLICPIMDKIEQQAQQGVERIAEQRREAKRKIDEANVPAGEASVPATVMHKVDD